MNKRLFKRTCGAKAGAASAAAAAVADPVVILIPQMQKFTHRWNRR